MINCNDSEHVEFSPFTMKGNKIHIPEDYRELFVDDDLFSDKIFIRNNKWNQKRLLKLYTHAFHMRYWYDDALPTPKTHFYNLDEIDMRLKFDKPKFVRLDSVSPKHRKPVHSMFEAMVYVNESLRCQNSIKSAVKYEIPAPMLCIREWCDDIMKGDEFRCFIFNEKLVAVSSHDEHCCDLDEDDILQRVSSILAQVKGVLPFKHVVMDVSLNNTRDMLIEFNSYGAFSICGSGSFSWIEDYACLHGLLDHVIVRINK